MREPGVRNHLRGLPGGLVKAGEAVVEDRRRPVRRRRRKTLPAAVPCLMVASIKGVASASRPCSERSLSAAKGRQGVPVAAVMLSISAMSKRAAPRSPVKPCAMPDR